MNNKFPRGKRAESGIYDEVSVARWKGAGMGDYECTLCGETVSGNRERYCPYCGATMYTDDEYDEMLRAWAAEDEADRAFYSLEGII